MATIFHQVVINSDRNQIYDAITTQVGLSKWWILDCDAQPEIGYVNEFRVEGHGVNKMKVIDLVPGIRVEWECCNENDPWTGTHIIFELSEKQNGCVLNFKHAGWESQTDFFATCNYHWARHLTMLVELCETGTTQLDRQTELNEVRKVLSD